jgi:hypothetical protein
MKCSRRRARPLLLVLPTLAVLLASLPPTSAGRAGSPEPVAASDLAEKEPLEPPEASPQQPAWPSGGAAVFVPTDTDVRLLSTRGEELTRLPVTVPPGHSLFDTGRGLVYVLVEPDAAEGRPSASRLARLVQVDLRLPSVRTVAVLEAPEACPVEDYGELLALQDPLDFSVDADSGALCVSLADRNANMVSLSVDYRVEPLSGSVEWQITGDYGERCTQAAGGDVCQRRRLPATAARYGLPDGVQLPTPPWDDAFDSDDDSCDLVLPEGRRVALPALHVCDANVERTTADGRYALIGTYRGEGDSFYRDLHVIDLIAGRVESGLTAIISGESRLEWAPDGQSILVEEDLWVLDGHPRALSVGRGALFVELNGAAAGPSE